MATLNILNSQKTFMHSFYEGLRSVGANFSEHILPNSTINQKLGLQVWPVGGIIPATTQPVVKYLCMGRGGMYSATVANPVTGGSEPAVDVYKHLATDAVPFELVPLLVVLPSDPGYGQPQPGYFLRTVEDVVINGVTIVNDAEFYYLAEIALVTPTPELRIVTVTDGVTVTDEAFDPEDTLTGQSMQNPTPAAFSSTEANLVNGRQIVVRVPFQLTLNEAQLENLTNAIVTKYGDISFARVTETGICHGVEYDVPAGGGRREVAGCQVLNHIAREIPLAQPMAQLTLSYRMVDALPLPDRLP